jgi:hypothetical protein
LRVTLWLNRPRILDFYNGSALVSLPDQHEQSLEDIHGLEPGDDTRFPLFFRQKTIRFAADHYAHMTRTKEPTDKHLTRFHQRFHWRRHYLVTRKDKEIRNLAASRLFQDSGGQRGGRLEPDPEEYNPSPRFLGSVFERLLG